MLCCVPICYLCKIYLMKAYLLLAVAVFCSFTVSSQSILEWDPDYKYHCRTLIQLKLILQVLYIVWHLQQGWIFRFIWRITSSCLRKTSIQKYDAYSTLNLLTSHRLMRKFQKAYWLLPNTISIWQNCIQGNSGRKYLKIRGRSPVLSSFNPSIPTLIKSLQPVTPRRGN